MVAVSYKRWSFTRGSNCKAFRGEILVFWISGRLREVVAHGGSTVCHLLPSTGLSQYYGINWNKTSWLFTKVVKDLNSSLP